MKQTILAIAIGCAIASPALAQSVGEKSGVNSVLGVAPKTEDFIKEAATSDMLEIEAAKIAQQKGTPPRRSSPAAPSRSQPPRPSPRNCSRVSPAATRRT